MKRTERGRWKIFAPQAQPAQEEGGRDNAGSKLAAPDVAIAALGDTAHPKRYELAKADAELS